MLTLRARAGCGASILCLALALGTPAHAGDIAPADAGAGAAGQVSARPTISGHVYDDTGAALPGARITVEGTPFEASTDAQGGFTIAVSDPGQPVTLAIDYLGRPHTTRTVDPANSIEIVLPAAGQPGDIVVTGASLLDNTARALNQQRQADNTVTILSADAIGRFPDPNIAEALQRVPGIAIERDQGEGRYINVRGAPSEFSAVSVDGVQIASVDPSTRAVDLDTLPSDIVANIAVTKTLVPSQDADSISGAVNITTRSAFDRRGFALTGMAGASYNQFGDTSDYRASASVSDRFSPDRQFGVLLSGSYSKTHRRPDNVENGWVRNSAGQYLVGETFFKDYDTKRERIAGTGALEWRPADGHRLYLRGSYAQFEDDEYRDRLGIVWSDGTVRADATDTAATYDRTRINKQVRHRTQRNEIWTVVGGGENRLGAGKLSYDVSYTRSQQTYPNRNELLFRSTLRPTLSYNFANNADLPTYSLFTSNEHLQTANYGFYENTFRSNTTKNDTFSAQIRGDVPAELGSGDATLSIGGRYRERTVDADEERFRNRDASAALGRTLAGVLSDQESRNFDYDLGDRIDPAKADDYFAAARPNSPRRVSDSRIADYRVKEKVLGIFGMGKFEFGATTLIAGLRVESTDFRGDTATYNAATNVYGARTSKTGYVEFFPNLTLRQEFSPNLIGRFALTRGINRPNFVDLVPRTLVEDDGVLVVRQGNADLRPTLSNNVDAGLEYYIRPLGIVAVNAFYKDLEDYRYTVTRNGIVDGRVARLTQPINAPKGKLYGVELNWQQQFSFLPGLLGGFGVFANYTYTAGDARLAQADLTGRSVFNLPGQSKHMWNASLFYERGPVNLRVAYTKRSDYLDEINTTDRTLDLYWEGRGQLDATGSVQVTKEVNLFVEGKNLTNSAGVRYFGERQRVYEYEKFGYTIFGGVRVKL
ncbi:TonB-dependent receptor [Sphingomonas adhaesiva]|uniref:TonB-dependent receptor n=1 Tax=Sphingomonas adhaesiva TaxID=28212 RepID=UPI002FFD29AC